MDLVILAAGMGSRFGGCKQIEPVDADGNFILDYSVHDAVKAGFDRVILIIRKEHEKIFEETVGKRLRKVAQVLYAFQNLEDVPAGAKIPEGRTKPWGTAHALYAAKDVVSDKFAVINADDFYGLHSYQILYKFLQNSAYDQFVCAGFQLKNTLSDNGMVKRGLLFTNGHQATGLVESRVERRDGKIFATPLNEDNWHEISQDAMVSLTTFGFSKKIFTEIEKEMQTFFSQDESALKTGEVLLPEVVGKCIKSGTTLEVIPTSSTWYGITYREELEAFKNAIQRMKDDGQYPQHLYQ